MHPPASRHALKDFILINKLTSARIATPSAPLASASPSTSAPNALQDSSFNKKAIPAQPAASAAFSQTPQPDYAKNATSPAEPAPTTLFPATLVPKATSFITRPASKSALPENTLTSLLRNVKIAMSAAPNAPKHLTTSALSATLAISLPSDQHAFNSALPELLETPH